MIIICESCGEVLLEKTDDMSGLYICRSSLCICAVRKGKAKEISIDYIEKEKTAEAA